MSVERSACDTVDKLAGVDWSGMSVIVSSSPIYVRRDLSRRRADKESAKLTYIDIIDQIAKRLHETHSPIAAREVAAAAGLADCAFFGMNREEAIAILAQRFRANDNAWDGGLDEHGVLSIHFWHDKSHHPVR